MCQYRNYVPVVVKETFTTKYLSCWVCTPAARAAAVFLFASYVPDPGLNPILSTPATLNCVSPNNIFF